MSISGEYEYRVDAKGRMPIPPRFRGTYAQGIVLARGFDQCIVAYPPPVWESIATQFSAQPLGKSKQRKLERFIFGNAFELDVDEQGRVLLPPKLREYADIRDAAVIVGANTRFEIWNKELWEKEQADDSEQASRFIEQMEYRE